jgi:hypothetical protein
MKCYPFRKQDKNFDLKHANRVPGGNQFCVCSRSRLVVAGSGLFDWSLPYQPFNPSGRLSVTAAWTKCRSVCVWALMPLPR